jgi:hypothetical protein
VSPHFNSLFEAALRQPQLRNVLVTNGLLIDEAWAQLITASNSTVIYSLDGFRAETYEAIRIGGRWRDVLASLDAINRSRRRLAASTANPSRFELILQVTVMKSNCRELEPVVEFARRHDFTAVNILPIQNVFEPENIFYHRDRAALDAVARSLPRIQEGCQRHGIRLHVQLPLFEDPGAPSQGPVRAAPQEQPAAPGIPKADDPFCYWPWLSLFVLLRGSTKPYGWCCQDVEHDLKAHSLLEIWNNERMRSYRSKIGAHDAAGFCDARCTSGVMAKKQLGRYVG